MISFGFVDDRPVFMDERTDSYFLLGREYEALFLDLLASGQPIMADPSLVAAFGVCEPGSIIQARCPRPTRSMFDASGRSRPSLSDIFRVGRTILGTKSLLARQSIESILSALPIAEADWNGSGPEQADERVLAFIAARKHIPIGRNCLLDSIALLHWLGPARRSAALVFGAKLDPFAAHCWLQMDDLLLNDRLDSIVRFCPVRCLQCSRATH